MSRYVLTILVSFFLSIQAVAQQEEPQIIYLINEKIVTEADINSLNPERIKSMDKNISTELKEQLSAQTNENLEDCFFMAITLYSDEEYKAHQLKKKEESVEIKETNIAESFLKNGDNIPELKLKLSSGEYIDNQQLKGKVVLINFWASWCAPCIREFYDFPKELFQNFNSEEFLFLPISIDANEEEAIKKQEKLAIDGIVLNNAFDPDSQVFSLFAPQTIPRSYLIDRHGKIIYQSVGYDKESISELVKMIRDLIE